jgi:hypothetical protein
MAEAAEGNAGGLGVVVGIGERAKLDVDESLRTVQATLRALGLNPERGGRAAQTRTSPLVRSSGSSPADGSVELGLGDADLRLSKCELRLCEVYPRITETDLRGSSIVFANTVFDCIFSSRNFALCKRNLGLGLSKFFLRINLPCVGKSRPFHPFNNTS